MKSLVGTSMQSQITVEHNVQQAKEKTTSFLPVLWLLVLSHVNLQGGSLFGARSSKLATFATVTKGWVNGSQCTFNRAKFTNNHQIHP